MISPIAFKVSGRGVISMQLINLAFVGGLAALTIFAASGAEASIASLAKPSPDDGKLVQKVHSAYQAEATLHRRGYYDVRLERPTLPYSFSACKRGVRYHIHVDYYGDLTQVDARGPCNGYGYGHYGRRPYYERPHNDRYRDRFGYGYRYGY
jgi:hypothetical protein